MKCQKCGTITDYTQPDSRAYLNGLVLDLCLACTHEIENMMTHNPCNACGVFWPGKELWQCYYCKRDLCPECEPKHDKSECARNAWESGHLDQAYGTSDSDFYSETL